jgi:hypothetical protein
MINLFKKKTGTQCETQRLPDDKFFYNAPFIVTIKQESGWLKMASIPFEKINSVRGSIEENQKIIYIDTTGLIYRIFYEMNDVQWEAHYFKLLNLKATDENKPRNLIINRSFTTSTCEGW